MVTTIRYEILLRYQFPVDILTKSPLVLRDLDLITKFKNIEAERSFSNLSIFNLSLITRSTL